MKHVFRTLLPTLVCFAGAGGCGGGIASGGPPNIGGAVATPAAQTTDAAKVAPPAAAKVAAVRVVVDPERGGAKVIAPDGTESVVAPSESFHADGHGAFGRITVPAGSLAIQVDLSGYGSRASAMRWALAAVPTVALGSMQSTSMNATVAWSGKDPSPILFVAETPGTAEFRADDGEDWALWNGSPAFDARAVAAEIAGFRAALRELFGVLNDGRKLGIFLDVDAQRPRGAFSVGRHGDVIFVRVGPSDPWTGPVRLATLAAVTRGYIGETMRLAPGEDDGWFAGGAAHAFTRALLASWNGIEASELASDQNALLLAAASQKAGPEEFGAIYMNTADRDAVRAGVTNGIVPAFVDLQKKASANAGVVSKSAVLTVLSKATGKNEVARFEGAVAKRTPMVFAPDRCLLTKSQTIATWEFPFDLQRSRQAGLLFPRTPPADVLEKDPLPFGAPFRELSASEGTLVAEVAGVVRTFKGTPKSVRIEGWAARRAGPCERK